MSSTPSVSRIQSPAERGAQRSDRPAGDFAAIMDALPAPARGPVRATAERSRHERPADPARSRPVDRRPDDPATREDGRDLAGAAGRVEATQLEPLNRAAAASEPVPAAHPAPVLLGAPATTAPANPAAIAPPPAADPPALPAPTAPAPPAPVATTTATSGPEVATPPLAFAPAGPPLAAAPAAPAAPGASVLPGAAAAAVALPQPDASAIPALAGETPVAAAPAGAPAPAGEPVAATPDALAPAPSEAAAPEAPVAEPAAHGTVGITSNGGAGGSSGSAGGRDGGGDGTDHGEPASATPAPGSPTAPAPTAPAAGRVLDGMPTGTHSAVPLERAPRAVAQLLRVGAEGGVSHARIALRPVELGGIEIFLQVGPAGLTAQVIAESPEAARMLQQAGEELRRSLAGHDVELVSLDVSTSSEHSQRDDLRSREGLADFGDAAAAPRRSLGADSGAAEPTSPAATVLELPDGLLVDVLA